MTWVLPERPRIAVAGATGAVGRELLTLLEREAPADAELVPLASERSVGREIVWRDRKLRVELLRDEAFDDIELAYFACGGERSLRFAPEAAKRACVVIDNSSAYRLDESVPLVVPEVNASALFAEDGELTSRIIANPNCSTILLVVVLAPIAHAFGLERVICSTYQAASGAGQAGMDSLVEDLRKRFVDGAEGQSSADVFGHPLAFNLVPQIDRFVEDGMTGEERKMIYETRKILGQPELAIDATCVRVPVLRSHSESVSLETQRPVSPDELRRVLAAAPGLIVVDDPAERRYPMPRDAEGTDPVLVGRIRQSRVFENGVSLWLSGDQLLKGAALNAVQIGRELQRARA